MGCGQSVVQKENKVIQKAEDKFTNVINVVENVVDKLKDDIKLLKYLQSCDLNTNNWIVQCNLLIDTNASTSSELVKLFPERDPNRPFDKIATIDFFQFGDQGSDLQARFGKKFHRTIIQVLNKFPVNDIIHYFPDSQTGIEEGQHALGKVLPPSHVPWNEWNDTINATLKFTFYGLGQCKIFILYYCSLPLYLSVDLIYT